MGTELNYELCEDEMPLFPLENVVLFPGGVLPLHIFEERYRLMIQVCLKHERPFGVVLIRHGREVGKMAEPYLVGVAVRIIDVNRLEDGRMDLVTLGQHRFEIIRLRQDLPYLVGKVRRLNADDTKPSGDLKHLVARASRLYRTYESSLAEFLPRWEAAEQIPTDAYHLSYQIGMRLQTPLADRQRLLEIFPIDRLLSEEIQLLGQENEKLKASLIARTSLERHGMDERSLKEKASLN